MNNCSFIGRCGGDAEVRFSKAGKPIVTFSLAVDSGWGDKKQTTWLRATGFGERWQKVAEYIKKGDRIGAQGQIELQEWENKEGEKKSSLILMLNEITLLAEKKNLGLPPGRASAPKPEQGFADLEEDIPFSNPYKDKEYLY